MLLNLNISMNTHLPMYGEGILCSISNGTFRIPRKISYPSTQLNDTMCIQRCDSKSSQICNSSHVFWPHHTHHPLKSWDPIQSVNGIFSDPEASWSKISVYAYVLLRITVTPKGLSQKNCPIWPPFEGVNPFSSWGHWNRYMHRMW